MPTSDFLSLPVPNPLGAAGQAVGGGTDPFVRPPNLTAPAPRFQNLNRDVARLAGAAARRYADVLEADKRRSQTRAQAVGNSDEVLEALQGAVDGLEPGSPAEIRAVEDVLARFGVERVADRVTVEQSLGQRLALEALGPVSAKVQAGEYARDTGGTAKMDAALAEARQEALARAVGTTARDALAATFDVGARQVREEGLKAAAGQRRADAAQVFAGEVAAGSPDGGRRGLGGLATADANAQAEILSEVAETIQKGVDLGHLDTKTAIDGLRAAIDTAPSPDAARRIFHTFTTRFEFPSGMRVTRDDGTIAGPADFVSALAALEKRIDEDERRELGVSAEREDLTRRTALRRFGDEAAAAGIRAVGVNQDYRPAAARAVAEFLRTEEGQKLTSGMDSDTIQTLTARALDEATEVVEGQARATTAAVQSATNRFETALAQGDLVKARAIADSAPGAARLELNARLEGTDAGTLQAIETSAAPARRELDAAREAAVKMGDSGTLARIAQIEGELDAALAGAIRTPAADAAELQARLQEATRPVLELARESNRRAQELAAAGNALEDAVGPLLFTNPREASRMVDQAQGAPEATKNRLRERIQQHQGIREAAFAAAENRLRADIRDLVPILTAGRDLTDADVRRAEQTILAQGRALLATERQKLDAAGVPTGDLGQALLDAADGTLLPALQAGIPGLESIDLTAEQQVRRANLQELRAAAQALDVRESDTTAAATAAQARATRVAGVQAASEAPIHLQRLNDALGNVVANRDGGAQFGGEVARFWLQAANDEERAAGVQALLASGTVPLSAVARGEATGRIQFADPTEAGTSLAALMSGSDIPPEEARALRASVEGLEPGQGLTRTVGPYTVTARRTRGIPIAGLERFGSDVFVALSLPTAAGGPGGPLAAIRPPADFREAGGSVVFGGPFGSGGSVRFKTAEEILGGLDDAGRANVANALGLESSAPTEELSAALLKSFRLSQSYR